MTGLLVGALVLGPALMQATLPARPQPAFRGTTPGAMPPAGPPLPDGQEIVAHDGDTIVVNGTDRIRLVRREAATVRVVYDTGQKRVAVFVDESQGSAPPDGFVDERLTFEGIDGPWPLPDRWEGQAVVEEYVSFDRAASRVGFGLTTPAGLIQLMIPSPTRTAVFRDPRAIASLTYRSGGNGPVGRNLTFDAAEQMGSELDARAQATRDRFSHGVGLTVDGPAGTPGAPVRVGGNIPTPTKIYDVRPRYPPEAQAAHVTGVVILEATVAPDGSVQDARILRSIPLLDDAAIAAVKQWKYAPTLLNGQAMPVILTVTVNFSMMD